MRIQHNIMAMNAYRNYNNNVSAMRKNLEKLSSGYKINRAGDDAAGLAISEKMRAQITGLETAQKNAKDGISLVQTAEGALTEVHDMLNRMVTLATQSANGTYDSEVDRVQLQKELDQLRTEINRIADSANFNGIKLFDGSLSGADITVGGVTTSTVDMAKGIEVTQGNDGGGSCGTYTINIDTALSDGDVLTIKVGGKAYTDNGNSDTITLTYGDANDIKSGTTLEEQAKNLAAALKNKTPVNSNFKIEVNGTSVTLTSNVEGNKTSGATTDKDITSTILSASVTTDKVAAEDSTNWKETQTGVDPTGAEIKFEQLFEGPNDGTTTGINIDEGDEVCIEVKLANGQWITLKATAGEEFEAGGNNGDVATNLVNYLTSDSAKFEDSDATDGVDESQIKFKDLYTASAVVTASGNKGYGLTLKQESGYTEDVPGTSGGGGQVRISVNKKDGSVVNATSGKSTKTTSTSAKAATYTMKLDSTKGSNLTIGDTLKIKGTLVDGRTFDFDVEAGKDFDVGKDYDTTMTNLKKLLESDFEVNLKNADGADVGSVKGSSIFGDNAEIKMDFSTANSPAFVSNAKGTVASKITSVELNKDRKAADIASTVSTKLKNGDQQTSADSTITFSEGVEYGAVIEVDGKKYELVKNASDVSNGQHSAVVVDDISDTSGVAKALASKLKSDLDSAVYKVTSSGNTVTIATTKVGSTAKAISMSSSGDKTTQLEFTLDPSKMKVGSTVTINGQTYEFIDKDGQTSDKKNIGIEIPNFAKETSYSLGSALAKEANGQKNAQVLVGEDGKVTVRGLVDPETNEIVTPTVKFDGGTSGLMLQIGDTADDYNKMRVSIYNMHTADMGIADISIADQDSAGAAIDKIRNAINYVSDVRGTLGATQNRLDHTINNLSAMQENIQDAESTIRDTDVASEMMAYTKNNILIQSAQAMLAQANQVPQGVLQLLQ